MEANIDGLKNGMEVKMDGIEEKMKANMEELKNGLKEYMEGLKEGLTKFLQEMLPNGEKVLNETRDEKKMNVSHDSRDSNFGLKTYHIPKINMNKFYGKEPVTWMLQME